MLSFSNLACIYAHTKQELQEYGCRVLLVRPDISTYVDF